MKFIHKPSSLIKGTLIYKDEEKSLDFIPETSDSVEPLAALVVGHTLQIHFRVRDGRLLYASGYFPKESWQREQGNLSIDKFTTGSVYIQLEEIAKAGMGYGTQIEEAPASFFEKSGWLLIGKENSLEEADSLTEIAEDVIVGLKEDNLVCLLLKPKIEK